MDPPQAKTNRASNPKPFKATKKPRGFQANKTATKKEKDICSQDASDYSDKDDFCCSDEESLAELLAEFVAGHDSDEDSEEKETATKTESEDLTNDKPLDLTKDELQALKDAIREHGINFKSIKQLLFDGHRISHLRATAKEHLINPDGLQHVIPKELLGLQGTKLMILHMVDLPHAF